VQPFDLHTGTFVCLDRANIDTDAIMPARFLKRIERVGYGQLLFMDLRQKNGRPDPDFPLNRPAAQGATVLVARQNFGCGSSREHAVWAIAQAGFRAVVAPRVGSAPAFADIFRNNCYKNGLLPVEVHEAFIDRLFRAGSGRVTIDLGEKWITAFLSDEEVTESFDVPEGARAMLLDGLDEIALTLKQKDAIAAYEARRPNLIPSAS
jgi:3-isopropylmalate/(R)-2-methylmalate dehydratase small subunit